MATSSRGATPTKRLLQELQDYQSDPNPVLLRLGPVNDDELMKWEAVMKGVEGTAYEGGLWLLNISIPSNYPHSPPTIRFAPSTPICHANVAFRDAETVRQGDICLDLLKDAWVPTSTISGTLTAVHLLLTSAEPDSPLNLDVAQLLRAGDDVGARSLIRYYTTKYRYEDRR